MMTKRQIESKLPEGFGIDKAEGVWYFNGEETISWYNRCSDFCTLDQGTLDQWLNSFEICRATKNKDGYGIER